jgi:hypothetical protein
MSITLRRFPLVFTALLAVLVTGQAAGAQAGGFMFKGEALNAQFSSVDAEGIVTNVTVYADDQRYNVKGQGGPGERTSSFYVTIEQYDPSCVGGPKLDAQAGGGGGDPTCFYRSLEGSLPGKDGGPGLPDDAFVVSNHQLDGAWLNGTITMVEWDSEGNSKLQDVTVSLSFTPTTDIYQIHENWLRHTPPDVQTVHINSRQRDGVATGTMTLDGGTLALSSTTAVVADFQQVNT